MISPVLGAVSVSGSPVLVDGFLCAIASFTVGSGEPVFAGHYPSFPLFPGVCVVECVHRAAVSLFGGSLVAMDSVRFQGPVVPGDVLTIALKWRDGVCAAEVTTPRGPAASVKLQYSGGAG
ncbi:hypothetical protein Lesp02_12830 [Lentzea sp. NBRC 105346]|nr:hypothetical protein Lesp02_12830 [Lentzea sp. NBRC 105346]